MRRATAAAWALAGLLLAGCDWDRSYGPDTGFPDAPTVLYRVTATPDTVAPGGWVRLRCVVRDSLDPRVSYVWNDHRTPGLEALPRTSEIVVQAPSDEPASWQGYSVRVTRSGFDGEAFGSVSFYVK